MKKSLAVLFVLVFVMGIFSACGEDEPVSAANNGNSEEEGAYGTVKTEDGYYQDFTFYNSTGNTLVGLYASAGGSNQWLNNMLEETVLEPEQGITLTIYIIPGDTTDFRVVAENGAEHELRGYELEEFNTLELVSNDDGTAVILLS